MKPLLRSWRSPHREPFRDVLLETLPIIAIVLLFTIFLRLTGWLDVFESSLSDVFTYVRGASAGSATVSRYDHVVLVGIGDDEYRSPLFFGDTSPLDAQKLFAILADVAVLQPSAIGVDVDTATSKFSHAPLSVGASWPPLVWETVATHWHDGRILATAPVTYGRPALFRKRTDVVADADFPVVDIDGVWRRYGRQYERAGGPPIDSFPRALARLYCSPRVDAADLALREAACRHTSALSERGSDEFPLVDYRGECLARESSAECLEPASTRRPGALPPEAAALPGCRTAGGLATAKPYLDLCTLERHARLQRLLCAGGRPCAPDPLVRGRIVLVGGLFSASGDVHQTPFGPRFGSEIIARATETEIAGTGITPVNEVLEWLADVCVGIGLTWFGWYFRALPALLLSIAFVPAVLLLASFVAFAKFDSWLGFVPMVIGIAFHDLSERGVEYVRLRRRASHGSQT